VRWSSSQAHSRLSMVKACHLHICGSELSFRAADVPAALDEDYT
jgi:hypothetical protein